MTTTTEGNGEEHRTTITSQGYYVFPELFAGKVFGDCREDRLKTFLKTGIVINPQAKLNVDVGLTVGAVNEKVEVQASTAQVQTDSASVGSAIENKQIQNLTLNGRALQQLGHVI